MAQPISKTNRLFAVLDTEDAALGAAEALRGAGFPPSAAIVLHGDEAAERIALGRDAGWWTRLMRAVDFTQADQSVDMATYEYALRDGRYVLAVEAPRDAARRQAVEILASAGAHFMNYYGLIATQDISPWRGPRPDVPWQFHR